MIRIDNFEVEGFLAAARGMRNPMNSWDRGDTHVHYGCCHCPHEHVDCSDHRGMDGYCLQIGRNDLALMRSLAGAGNDHGKFLRMITVYVDLEAPLYWWKEFDTYKVGTVTNSCSTMHKIAEKEFSLGDFSTEHLSVTNLSVLESVILSLNSAREDFNKSGDKYPWWQMIQMLPSSYNQRRTVMLNYQVLKNIYFARRNHKLDEWRVFCAWIMELPYFKEIVLGDGDNDKRA